MSIAYFKRFRMEINLNELAPLPPLPEGYAFVPWDETLLEVFAEVKYYSFMDEIDSVVFRSLGSKHGCSYLMREISRKVGFRPEATWLVANAGGSCGTIQGISERSGLGAIQNLGVLPQHRGRGLGKALLMKALYGFRNSGLGRAFLEVTAQNESAIRLYRQLGFRCRKTIYKMVETEDALLQAAGTLAL
jgi:ribosomal protein S18 acetylase RimI-like enzyme